MSESKKFYGSTNHMYELRDSLSWLLGQGHEYARFDVTCKVHGAQSSISLTKEGVTLRSRSNDLMFIPEDTKLDKATIQGLVNGIPKDKRAMGFPAAMINKELPWLLYLQDSAITYAEKNPEKIGKVVAVNLHGEWFGRGIHKQVGVSRIDKKFGIFAVEVLVEGEEPYWVTGKDLVEAYDTFFEDVSENVFLIPNVFLVSKHLSLEDLLKNDGEKLKEFQGHLKELTDAVELHCPVAANFNAEEDDKGLIIGEGVVLNVDVGDGVRRAFKLKGVKHIGKAKTNKAQKKKQKFAVVLTEEQKVAYDNAIEYMTAAWRLDQFYELAEDKSPKGFYAYFNAVKDDALEEHGSLLPDVEGLNNLYFGDIRDACKEYFFGVDK